MQLSPRSRGGMSCVIWVGCKPRRRFGTKKAQRRGAGGCEMVVIQGDEGHQEPNDGRGKDRSSSEFSEVLAPGLGHLPACSATGDFLLV